MTSRRRIFAYGSNLAIARIEERVGPVVVVATGRLDGHVLRFHKAGRDGSGKADAFATGIENDCVYGAIYEMGVAAKKKLDRCEGLGADYLEKHVTIATTSGAIGATMYYAHPVRIAPAALPFDWYHRLVVDGARHHGLPAPYVEAIASHAVRIDPDLARVGRALRLLTKR